MNDVTIVGMSVGAGGLLLGAIFVALGVRRSRMVSGWTHTVGIVTDKRGDVAGMRAVHPTFMWQDATGTWHRHTSTLRQSFPPRLGSQVPVRYDPQAPHRGVIDTVVQRRFTVIGAILMIIAVTAGGTLLAIASTY